MFINTFRRSLPKLLLYRPLIFSIVKSRNRSQNISLSKMGKLTRAKQSIPKRYKTFDDIDSEIIHDQTIDLDLVLNQKRKKPDKRMEVEKWAQKAKKGRLDLRGNYGVFDIDELVQFLTEENLKDIAVIKVPKHLKYCDFIVVCSAKSNKQIKKSVQSLSNFYQAKKHDTDGALITTNDSSDWKLVDLENIILHIFLPETRDFYDLETLWTVGEKYDDKTQLASTNIMTNILEQHFKFVDEHVKDNQTSGNKL